MEVRMRGLSPIVLVACVATAPAPSPPPPPPLPPTPIATTEVAADFATPPPAAPPLAPRVCGQDEVFELQCGGIQGAAACGPRGDSLTSFAGSRGTSIRVFTFGTGMGNDPAYRDFVLDEYETSVYRTTQGLAHPNSWGSYCCYSHCTPLAVAASAPKPHKIPSTHQVADVCIPPPQGGTSVPSSADPACPAAVELSGTLGAYRGKHPPLPRGVGYPGWYDRSGGQSCCYSVVVRKPKPPPDNDGHCPTCKCAAAGTPIATPTGEVPIESLAPGDLVLSIHRGVLTAVPLAATNRIAADHDLVVLALASGRSVAMSPQHPTADGRTFQDLAVGARLGDAEITAIARAPYAGLTHDLLPASDTGTYVAAGALVGSTLFRATLAPSAPPSSSPSPPAVPAATPPRRSSPTSPPPR
jgi:hypothetical protein